MELHVLKVSLLLFPGKNSTPHFAHPIRLSRSQCLPVKYFGHMQKVPRNQISPFWQQFLFSPWATVRNKKLLQEICWAIKAPTLAADSRATSLSLMLLKFALFAYCKDSAQLSWPVRRFKRSKTKLSSILISSNYSFSNRYSCLQAFVFVPVLNQRLKFVEALSWGPDLSYVL